MLMNWLKEGKVNQIVGEVGQLLELEMNKVNKRRMKINLDLKNSPLKQKIILKMEKIKKEIQIIRRRKEQELNMYQLLLYLNLFQVKRVKH